MTNKWIVRAVIASPFYVVGMLFFMIGDLVSGQDMAGFYIEAGGEKAEQGKKAILKAKQDRGREV